MTRSFLLLLAVSVTALPAAGQSVEEEVRRLGEENAREYVRPVGDGLSFAFTGGLFDGAAARRPFAFELGVRVVAAITPGEVRRFEPILPASIEFDGRVFEQPFQLADGATTTPTAAGTGPGVVLEPAGAFRQELIDAGEDPERFEISFPEGVNLRLVPTALLHVTAGVGFGSELTFRFIPTVAVDPDIGDLWARGWGVKHTLTHWFVSPIDVSVALGSQSLRVGEYLEASATEGWLLAGRALGPLTLFGAFGLRRASVDIGFTVENPTGIPGLPADGAPVAFSSDLDTTGSVGAGFRLQLLFLNLAGQYTVADYDTFALKLGLGPP
jgi:hypothetical protein